MARRSEQISGELPESLRQRFAALERRLWKIETSEAICQIAGGLVFSYLALFISDRIWDSPVWLRAAFAGLGSAVMAWAAAHWLRLWVLHRRDLRSLADLVQQTFPGLGDRLLGIVELSAEERHSPDFSPSLYRAAIRQVAAEAERFDFREAADPRQAKRYWAATSSLLVVSAALALLAPAVGWNVFLRWIVPLANVERYTLVALERLPGELIVPHGEPFAVEATVHYRSFWRPARAAARIERQARIESKADGGKLSVRFPGQTQRGLLRIKIGDAQKVVAVVPTYRPSLKELAATIKLPDYLQYPLLDEPVRGGLLSVVEDSIVSFHGRASRVLAEAQLQIEEKEARPLKVEGEQFSSDFVKRAGIFQCSFLWRDNLGLSNQPPLRLMVQTRKDAPPAAQLPDLNREVAMLYSDMLEIRARAQDDFGVRSLGLSWDIVSSPAESPGALTSEARVDAKSRQETVLERTFPWSPAALRIPPDSTVELVAFARDAFPDRDRTLSATCRIYVLGNEKHAELVRQRLDSLLGYLEEVTRLEEKIAADTAHLQNADEIKQTSERIEAVKQDQERNVAQLEQLAGEGAKALREALKNSVFPEEALRQWTQNLQLMQQLSQQQMKQAAEALKSAQQNRGSRAQDLAAAQQQEREALEKLAQMQNKMGQELDQLQALTLSQRLRQVAGWESEIEKELQKVIPETIGLLPIELPEKFRKVNASLAAAQGNAQTEAQSLQSEISRFFERTQKTNYGDVSKQMAEAKTVDELERVRGLIQENIAMQASKNSATWSRRFHEWADRLEPKETSSEGSNGSGSGSKKLDMTNTLIALLRLREGEKNLREQTRLLDQQRSNQPVYSQRSASLAETQKELKKSLGKLWKENEVISLEPPYLDAYDSMEGVEQLLAKPQTDAATDRAQAQAIDNLTDLLNLINEQAQRRPPPSAGESSDGSADEMAFLLRMMSPGNTPGQGMAMGLSGYGNPGGGTTDRPSGRAVGDPSGRAAGERRVNRVSGLSRNLPTEFREMLEKYYKALEQNAE